MKDFFKEILFYNFKMNEALMNYFEENSSKISEKAHLLLAHLVSAQHLWNNRVYGEKMVYGIWEIYPYETLKKINTENLETSNKILDENDLERVIFYKNIKGEDYQRTIKDIVFHYTNHSTYHRAQIATEIKNAGLEPLVTDYIYFKK